jgi:hypothetical protein
MRHLRMVGLALVAVFAMAAVAATSASALPEFGKCEAKAGGKYTDSNCTKKATTKEPGKFEFHNSLTFTKNVKEFSNGTGEKVPGVLTSIFHVCQPSTEKLPKCRAGEEEQLVGPVKVECEELFDLGEFSSKSAKEVRNLHVRFSGCKTLGSIPCSNTSTVGVIETNILKGLLGYIKKAAPKEVGIDIKPQSGKEFAKFTCSGVLEITVSAATEAEGPAYPPKGGGDGVIGVVTPINEMTSVLTQAFTANEETAENIPSKLEGKPLQVLEDFEHNLSTNGQTSRWSPAGQTVTAHNSCRACKGEEGVGEIKA